MNRQWTPGLRKARKHLVSLAHQELQMLRDPEVAELANYMLLAQKFEHSHFSDQMKQSDCAGCLIHLLIFHLPDFDKNCLDEVNSHRTIRFFEERLDRAKFGSLEDDEYWDQLQLALPDQHNSSTPGKQSQFKNSKSVDIDEPDYEWPTGRGTSTEYSLWHIEFEEQVILKIKDLVNSGNTTGDDPISLGGEILCEDALPLGYVMYPQFGGSIPAFSSTGNSEWVICSCHEPAINGIINLISNVPTFRRGLTVNEVLRREISIFSRLSDLEIQSHSIQFEDGICHYCNQILPQLATFPHRTPLLGPSDIVETPPMWGMYYRIACLKNGLQPSLFEGEDNCWDLATQEVLHLFEEIKEAGKAYHQLRMKTEFPVAEEFRDEWKLVNYEISNSWTRLYHYLENLVRSNFDIRPIGATGQQEDLLYKLVAELMPGEFVQRNYRPGWLEFLELDIWIPALNLGIEYQGEQHYVPIEAWGGEEKLKAQQERDRRKVKLCAQRGVTLVEFRFDEKLSRTLIRDRLSDWIIRSNTSS